MDYSELQSPEPLIGKCTEKAFLCTAGNIGTVWKVNKDKYQYHTVTNIEGLLSHITSS